MAKKSNKKSTNRKKLVANKAFKYQPGGNPYATPGSFTPASMSGAHQAQMQLAQIQNEMMQAQQQEQEANRLAQEEERKATMSSLATQGAQLGKTAKTAIAASEKAGKTAMQGLNNANVIGSAASLAGMGIQKLSDDDDDTRINFGEGLGGIMKGAGAGAAWGSALGPVGTAIGGLAGAGLSTYQMIKSRNQAREDEERDADYRLRMAEAQQRMAETAFSRTGSDMGFNVGPSMTNAYLPGQQMMAYQMGGGREMLKRADGSYSQRGLWDNIRANKGSGNAPTKQMLKQEKKIKQEMETGGDPEKKSLRKQNRQTRRAQKKFERKSKKGIQNTFQNGGESIMTSANNPQVGVVYDMGLTTNEHFDAPKIEVPSEGRYVKNATVQVDPRVSLPHRVMGFENAATYRNIGIPLNSRNNLFGPPVDFSRADSKNPNVFDTKNTTYQNQSFISPDSRLDFSNRNTNQTPDITIVYPQDEYKTGGQKVPGGMIKPLPGGAVEFVGPKHSQGGIMLDPQTEVEGGETMDKVKFSQSGNTGDYIFSDYLKLGGKTFAKRHKEMLNNGASQADIQNLAKMQEEVARKEGRDENGPRGAKYIAKMGGVRKYQGGTPGSSNQLLKDFTQQQIDEKVQELAQREQFIQEGLGMYNEFLNRTQNRPTNSNRSNSNEEEPYINNFPGNPWGFSDQENWARRNVLDENIDMEGYIGGQDYGNIADTAWGKYYSEGPGSTEAERKLFNTNREKWYQDVYVPRIEEYINENPDEAYSMLQQMLNSSDPNAENFKTKLLDKDGNMLPQEAALKIAKELATDTKIGSFHAFLAPKLTELPILGPDVPGIEVDRDITLDRVELPKTPPKTPPGVKTPPDVLLPWQMMGPLAALGSKYPQPEKVAPQPSGRLNLPRVNFNAERAANASATNATNKYIQNQAAGPGAIAAQMANNSAQRQGNIEIANQEARANKDLMAQEAMSNLQASQFNAQNAMQADAMNAQSQNIRNQMEYEKRMNASTALGNAAAQYGMDQRAYRAEERMASANQISGEYDRQKYLEALKRNARKRNSPYANMSDAELKEIAAQAINQSPTWNAQDKARVEALSSASTTKTEETDKKKKGGYIRRMNKIRR